MHRERDLSLIAGDHLVELDRQDIFDSGFLKEVSLSPYHLQEEFLERAYLDSRKLPESFHQAIYRFKNNRSTHGVLLLKNLPIEDIISKTPKDPLDYPKKSSYLSEKWIAAVAENLGYAVSYKQEKGGELFQNIVPVKENEEKLSSESSKFSLDFHTEIAFHPQKPDYIVLLCLRPDHEKEAKTFFASAKQIREVLSVEDINLLSKPLFKTGIDYSFGSNHGDRGNGPILNILDSKLDDFICFDLDLMVGVNDAADTVLASIKDAVNLSKYYVSLDKGDLLIIDNNKSVHGRSEFNALYDGYDRWLLRTCAIQDINLFKREVAAESPRKILTDFQI